MSNIIEQIKNTFMVRKTLKEKYSLHQKKAFFYIKLYFILTPLMFMLVNSLYRHNIVIKDCPLVLFLGAYWFLFPSFNMLSIFVSLSLFFNLYFLYICSINSRKKEAIHSIIITILWVCCSVYVDALRI